MYLFQDNFPSWLFWGNFLQHWTILLVFLLNVRQKEAGPVLTLMCAETFWTWAAPVRVTRAPPCGHRGALQLRWGAVSVSIATFQTFLYCASERARAQSRTLHVVEASMLLDCEGYDVTMCTLTSLWHTHARGGPANSASLCSGHYTAKSGVKGHTKNISNPASSCKMYLL